uniref:Uncharacterized protein n=1 Tax=viral metagenome TaxID=1070528 RepID=A0A6C0HEZ3_9ZZZZ
MCLICGTNLNIYIDNGAPVCVDCGFFLFIDQYKDEADLKLINDKVEDWLRQNDYVEYNDFEETDEE